MPHRNKDNWRLRSIAGDEAVALALRLGYSHVQNRDTGCSFQKGTRHVWAYKNHRKEKPAIEWQTADAIGENGKYENHIAFDQLIDALHRPLTEEKS